jgi:hypothetical protein
VRTAREKAHALTVLSQARIAVLAGPAGALTGADCCGRGPRRRRKNACRRHAPARASRGAECSLARPNRQGARCDCNPLPDARPKLSPRKPGLAKLNIRRRQTASKGAWRDLDLEDVQFAEVFSGRPCLPARTRSSPGSAAVRSQTVCNSSGSVPVRNCKTSSSGR